MSSQPDSADPLASPGHHVVDEINGVEHRLQSLKQIANFSGNSTLVKQPTADPYTKGSNMATAWNRKNVTFLSLKM